MIIDLLKPVTVQMAEEISRRMRRIETDPANGILPMPPNPEAFRIPASPVPPMILKLKAKHPAFLKMPHEPHPMHARWDDPRTAPNASAGANPSTVRYWNNVVIINRHREEIRRILARQGWTAREVAFIDTRHAESVLNYAIAYHRSRILDIKDDLFRHRRDRARAQHKLNLSRDELEAFISLLNNDRAWISSMMAGRAGAPRQIAEQQVHIRAQVKVNLIHHSEVRAVGKQVEQVSRDLAASLAATAYNIPKKVS